jgi:hypothetical protein
MAARVNESGLPRKNVLSVRLSRDEWDKIEAKARRDGRTMSDWVRDVAIRAKARVPESARRAGSRAKEAKDTWAVSKLQRQVAEMTKRALDAEAKLASQTKPRKRQNATTAEAVVANQMQIQLMTPKPIGGPEDGRSNPSEASPK